MTWVRFRRDAPGSAWTMLTTSEAALPPPVDPGDYQDIDLDDPIAKIIIVNERHAAELLLGDGVQALREAAGLSPLADPDMQTLVQKVLNT